MASFQAAPDPGAPVGGGTDRSSAPASAESRIYSPYAGRDYPDQVLFGDTHFHTRVSFDAGLIGTTIEGHASWSFDASLRAIAEADAGVLVLLSKPETAEDLITGIDRLLGAPEAELSGSQDAYNQIGMGAQILRDLGVGQIKLMGAPLKYNALAGFGLEVVEFVAPPESEGL